MNDQLPFGIDISKYNSSADGKKLLDFQQIALHPNNVAFIIARSGASWGYKDERFDYYWSEIAKIDQYRIEAGVKLPPVARGCYHVLYPGESVQRQVDNLFKIIGSVYVPERDRIAIDAELDHKKGKRQITDAIMAFGDLCKKQTGRLPILYSRTGWLNQFTYPAELAHFDLWLAQYLYRLPYPQYTPEHPGITALPTGCTKLLIHQTAERQPAIGGDMNRYMDYNRWQGTQADLEAYFGITEEPTEPPTGEGVYTLEQKVERLWQAHPELS